MDLLQLRYFFESAKNENFSQTAKKYMVPVTSVSASVKRLEKELGISLFDRKSNRITLNQNGKRLQKSLCVVFDELDGVLEALTVPTEDTREIKMLVRAMRSEITDHIIEYKKKHPHVTFKTVFDFTQTNFEDFDIIIDEKSENYTDCDSFEMRTMRLKMTVSENSSLLGKKYTLKKLCDQPFISMGEQNNMHKILIKACSNAGFTPNIVAKSNDIRCYEKWIESGMGIGIVRDGTPKNSLAFLDVADFDERYTIYCYFKKQSDFGNIAHFVNFLKKKAD